LKTGQLDIKNKAHELMGSQAQEEKMKRRESKEIGK